MRITEDVQIAFQDSSLFTDLRCQVVLDVALSKSVGDLKELQLRTASITF